MADTKSRMDRQISLARSISMAIIASRNNPDVSHSETYKQEEEKIEEENPMKVVESPPIVEETNEELPIKKEEPPVEKKEEITPTPTPTPPEPVRQNTRKFILY